MVLEGLRGSISLVYNNTRFYFNKMNLVLFSAAVDVVVVEGPDGTLRSTPFLVCFSTFRLMTSPGEKRIRISINGEQVEDVEMCLRNDRPQADFVGGGVNASERLRALHLRRGLNSAEFRIGGTLNGEAKCSCNVYMMKWTDQLVISDIDGTITKSDVLGHIIPAIGGTWAQASVADLYSRIQGNGYQLVYLSSRAMGLSMRTRTYLESIVQKTCKLPDGPVLLSPLSIPGSFRILREVIDRQPHEFKTACLTELRGLFPEDAHPFFAGFGNKETDVMAYKAVGIPPERIYIVNPSNEVTTGNHIGGTASDAPTTSYAEMAGERLDYLFPPINPQRTPEAMTDTAFWTPAHEMGHHGYEQDARR